jgi:hypothetical protein
MVVPFPSRPKPCIELSDEHLEHVALIEAYCDGLLAALYAQLPNDPARYPIRIGKFTIHYRRRPRAVVTPAPERLVG